MTLVAGAGTACSGKQSSYGDGCLAATGTALVSERSANIDYYGNILLGGYGSHLVHMICLNASPLCVSGTPSPTAANPLQIQIGYMGVVAGCAGNAGGQGTSGTGSENTPGFSYASYSVSAFKNSTACTASLGEVNKPEGITADVYGNVYYADSGVGRWRVVLGPQTYNGVTNPLYAILVKNTAWTTVTAGYVYTISGYPSTSATTPGGSCNGGGTATDGYGDGCLFTSSYGMGVTGYPTGMGVDAAGNMIYTDLNRGLRVFFVSDGSNFAAGTTGYIAGQRMKNAIVVNGLNYVTTSVAGFNYMLAGNGGTAIGTTTSATLGSQLSFDNKMYKLAVSPQGHVYIGDSGGPARVYFYDINTGYMRTLFTGSANLAAGTYCNGGTSGPVSLSKYSDGCPATKSLFSNSDSMSVGVDPQGNLYMYDGTEPVIRKVLAQGFSPQTLSTPGTALTQTFQIHLPEAAIGTASPATAAVSSSPDITVASGTNPTTPSCSQNADNTVDCTVTVTTTPSAVGQRSAALTVALPSGTWENASATINLNQTETGSVLVFDNAMLGGSSIALTPNAIFSSITPAAVAVDGAGNVYAASGTNIVEAIGSAYITLYSLSPSLSATPSQIAVDPTGNIFAVNRSVSTITELEVSAAGAPATYTATSVSYTPASGTAAPQAVATDQFGNLYVADYQTSGSSVYRLSWSPLSLTYQNQVTVASGLENPVSLAVDLAGNVFIADRTAGSISEYSPSMAVTTTTPLPLGTYSLAITHSMTAEAVAVDAGGNLYAQSGSDIYEIPVNGSEVAVYSGLSTPVGLAVDGLGNVYSADASKPSITQIVRNGLTCNFGTETTAGQATCGGTLTNAGNQVTTGSVAPSFFVLTGCGVNLNQIEALSAGEACELSTTMSGTATTPFTFLPAASTIGSVTLEGTLTAPHYATTTAITGPTEATPIYAASGTEATFTVTVAPGASSGYAGTDAPSGEPTVTVYSGTKTVASYTPSLSASGTSGIGTVYVSGLAAGNYTISANYGGGSTNGTVFDSSATSTVTSFTIGQVGPSVSGWTPSVTSQQVSAALGTSGVLNATATPSGVAGNFVYTATCTSGSGNCTQYSNTTIDAATYLPMGTYTLGVTFVPTDLTDYTASSSVTITGYTVTQASTTAAVGASTNVVASDGSGNYTTLSAALAALPVTGGTIYLKPGTYSGQNAISYPNVYLRGLGGDPTKVILTGENGAFSSPPTGFTLGPAGKGGDEGSATLDVSKNGYMGTTAASGSYSPYGFYADYLTIQNTYNTDLTTTSVNNGVTSSGTCTTTAATSLQTLYNSGTECGSQALAVWLGADQAILNNVNLTSQQDTLYAGYQGTSGSTYVPARQYIWQGLITGDVDYIFGDSALVLDHTNIFTTWHGTAATGTETITAQSKRAQTGSASDYLSGYICNACTLMSQTSTANGSAMTKLYYGRPYGVYSTFILLNSYADQVNPAGWVGWDGLVEYLSTSTYGEYNTQAYVDPAVGTAPYPSILFYLTTAAGGVVPSGGNIGYGVLSTSTPAAARESYALQLTPAQAVPYYPVNFLSTTVSTTGGYTGMPTTWNPVTALSAAVNFFAPTGNITLAAFNSSVTILGRPQTPGAGIIPTGSYAFYDSTSGATCTAATTNCTQLLSSNLDASGEAYLTTSTLAAGATHTITMVYGGDSNFAGSTSATFTITVPSATLTATTTNLTISNASSTYGGTISGIVSVAPTSGTGTPTGTVTLKSGGTTLGTCQLSGGSCSYALSNVASGSGQTMTANYSGDGTFGSSISNGVAFSVAPAVLTVTANNATMAVGSALPTFTYVITGYVNQDTSSVVSGIPALATTASSASSEGNYPITVSIGTLSASNYSFSSTGGILTVTGMLAVATGDSRTVTEPSFPAVCQQLNAAITSVSNDIPTSVDATNTNPDGARIQAALTSCAGSGKAVELSVDSTGVYNVFLSGPLSMPANVTLLVDPGVTLYFSRNAQDYDKVSGTHTCGTINTASATSSCLPLIDVPKTSTNAGIMGFGKVDGRGGDPLLNGFATSGYTEPSTYTWWTLASQADTDNGNQQNPRFIQLENGGSNFQLYKITILNSPMFHVSTVGSFAGFTAWDVKIVTPTDARNTDGIDPDQAQNFTITNSWISDGDDNIAVGASGSSSNVAKNISVTNNHFFAGHGESIGSYTSAGVSNVLFDNNMLWGNGSVDGNSTGIRIKSANDRGWRRLQHSILEFLLPGSQD
jgi:polygalacturonase/pectin methylesterase-like acyl-CoA thioesterase